MPFQSEKQRRYLHANHPEIANRWEAKYGLGGIAELNSQLNSLPEYYLPKNQGGLIPSHEVGIYGLAEGGRTGFQYGSPHDDSPTGSGSSFSGTGGSTSTSTSGGEGGHHGDVAHGSGGRFETANTRTTTTREVPPGEKGGPGYISPQDKMKLLIDKQQEENPIEYYGQRKIQYEQEILSKKTQDYILNNLQKLDPNKYYKDMGVIQKAIEMGQSIPMPTVFGILKALYNEKKLTSEGNALLEEWKPFIGGVPGSNPQAYDELWLALEKRKGKYKYNGDEDPGSEGVTGVASIKIDDIEGYNEKELASSRWRQEQEKVDRSKQDAYYAAFRQKYLMGDTEEPQTMFVAQGGRIPGGYNTGGLSNLFRLKNI